MMQNSSAMAISQYNAQSNSFNGSQDHGNQLMYTPSQQSMIQPYQSFPETNGSSHYNPTQTPQIYTAVYSGVSVYEMEIQGVAVMRRRSDSWLNATQILKVAGVDKGKRTKVLEKEILSGDHEKVQGGYGKYQGTWIDYQRGRAFCRQYGVEDILRPLLDHDMSGDGTSQVETPTKEQAMAANRKRLYNQTQENRQNQSSGGTFFSNLSSAATNAISAMNKAARLNTPNSRPSTGQRPTPRSMPNSQESFSNNTTTNNHNHNHNHSHNHNHNHTRNHNHHNHNNNNTTNTGNSFMDQSMMDGSEPPRKRLRGESFSQINPSFMRDGTPTEANDSFMYRQSFDGDVPVPLQPLLPPSDKLTEEKQSLLLDLFADRHRTDYTSHPALQKLSGPDLDLPLDQSANTALHWAATLARIPLMRLLISKGASIYRGNVAGETALMAAVQVNNCLDHTSFPDLLEILAPLIEMRDTKGRTILHHIAVACGIKGRTASSKYYLEALLEFLVKQSSSIPNSSGEQSTTRPLNFMRFMSEMVNARDISGNTALNLVARIGNRSIIRQLIEVQADPSIPNHKGLSPMDFGVEANQFDNLTQSQGAIAASPSKIKIPSRAEEISREVLPSLTSTISDMQSSFLSELRSLQERIDGSTLQIRELSARQKSLSSEVDIKVSKLRSRQDRKQRIINLRRAVQEIRERTKAEGLRIGEADAEFQSEDKNTLKVRIASYNSLNASLAGHLQSLKARDTELEAKYRKVVALCINVPEDKVDNVLGQLVTAVESETEKDVSRVRDFLKRVEAVSAN